MPYPQDYARDFGFASFQETHPQSPLPGDQVDVEFDAVHASTDAIVAFLARFARSDGRLANGSVGVDQLAPDLSIGFKAPTTWESGIQYVVSDTVFYANKFYNCEVAHTSGGTFTPEDWSVIVDFGAQADAAAASAATATTQADAAAASAATATTQAGIATTQAATATTQAGIAAANATTAAGYLGSISLLGPTNIIMARNYATPALADAAAVAGQGIVYLDKDFTLSGDTTLAAQWVGGGGIITLGNYNLTFSGVFDGAPIAHFAYTGSGVVAFSTSQSIANVNWINARAGGGTDDTGAVAACASASGRTIVFPAGGAYNVTATVTLLSGTTLQMAGATVAASCSSDPLFLTATAASQIRFNGGEITGTAGAFLKAVGSTDTPTQESHYARDIRLTGVRVSEGTIDKFLWLNKAVRKVFVDSCVALSANGIVSDGKGVEIYGNKSLFYSGTQAAGTYGLKLTSSGGTGYYNEGWYFTGCEVAEYEFSIYAADYFVFVFSDGLLQGLSSGHSAYFTTPTTTTHNFDAVINGTVVLDAPITVNTPSVNTRLALKNITTANQSVQPIDILSGTNGVTISNLTCADSSSAPAAVVLNGSNGNILINGLSTDSTFTNAVQSKGTDDSVNVNVSIMSVKHVGSGQAIYAEGPVFIKAVPVQSAGDIANVQAFNSSSISGTKTVGTAIASITASFAKGESGYIVIKLMCSGLAGGTSQRFDLGWPSGMSLPSGTGWAPDYIYPGFTDGLVSLMVPYACSEDIASGTVSITNAAGNSAGIASHSCFGIQRTV